VEKIEYIFKLEEGVRRPAVSRNIQDGVNLFHRETWHYHLDGYCDGKFKFHIDEIRGVSNVGVLVHPN